MKRIATAFAIIFILTQAAEAKHHHYHHSRHSHIASSRHHSGGGITHAKLANGQVIAVASAYVDRFVNFFNALYAREGHLPSITCLASGHMANSLHHWGGACDVGQTARNVAWRAMYHVGTLAAKFGLTDGCIWSHPDCGHIDVSGVGGSHYALRRHRHYATRTRIALAAFASSSNRFHKVAKSFYQYTSHNKRYSAYY